MLSRSLRDAVVKSTQSAVRIWFYLSNQNQIDN
jgi:hypothetical protein